MPRDFIKEITDRLDREQEGVRYFVAPKNVLGKDAIKSCDGVPTGRIYALEVFCKNGEPNTNTICNVIAKWLIEDGIEVYRDTYQGGFLVVQRNDRRTIHHLYGEPVRGIENLCHVFADKSFGVYFKDNKLMQKISTESTIEVFKVDPDEL